MLLSENLSFPAQCCQYSIHEFPRTFLQVGAASSRFRVVLYEAHFCANSLAPYCGMGFFLHVERMPSYRKYRMWDFLCQSLSPSHVSAVLLGCYYALHSSWHALPVMETDTCSFLFVFFLFASPSAYVNCVISLSVIGLSPRCLNLSFNFHHFRFLPNWHTTLMPTLVTTDWLIC